MRRNSKRYKSFNWSRTTDGGVDGPGARPKSASASPSSRGYCQRVSGMYDSAGSFSQRSRHVPQADRSGSGLRPLHGCRRCAAAARVSESAGRRAGADSAGRGGRGSDQLTVWMPHTVTAEAIDTDTNAKIRTEGMDHSRIMWIEHNLTDVYGPRPIGSPNHKAAADWAVKTMTSWGMKNAHEEPFTWKGEGWLPGRASGYITSPVKANIKFEVIPWTPSTNGTVSGDVVQILPPDAPTEAELSAYLASLAPRVKGRS